MTALPKLEGNYEPLKIYLEESTTWTAPERNSVLRAIKQWNWADPERAQYLPPLMEIAEFQRQSDVTVNWVEEVDALLLVVGHPVILKDSAFGCCVTDTETGQVDIYLDRNMHRQLGPGWRVPVALHELGHAGGLRHSDATVPSGIMQPGLVNLDEGHGFRMVTQLERERLRELRVDSVVGVDSLEGN